MHTRLSGSQPMEFFIRHTNCPKHSFWIFSYVVLTLVRHPSLCGDHFCTYSKLTRGTLSRLTTGKTNDAPTKKVMTTTHRHKSLRIKISIRYHTISSFYQRLPLFDFVRFVDDHPAINTMRFLHLIRPVMVVLPEVQSPDRKVRCCSIQTFGHCRLAPQPFILLVTRLEMY
jgi:hypothetical protein